MFAKLRYLPLARAPWMVSIHTPHGWKTLNTTYRNVKIPLETVLYLNALNAAANAIAKELNTAPGCASTACCSPTRTNTDDIAIQS